HYRYTQCHLFLFFFSSRRRHTRSKRDWSSDVCSSDLRLQRVLGQFALAIERIADAVEIDLRLAHHRTRDARHDILQMLGRGDAQIGRASCRESEGMSLVERAVRDGADVKR